MRVLLNDYVGCLTIIECTDVTAINNANTYDHVIKRDFKVDPDSPDFVGINGLHLIPESKGVEIFIPCNNPEERLHEALNEGKLDLSDLNLAYDAEDWDMY